MEAIRKTQKKYCSTAMILAIGVGFALILAGFKPVGKGLILGTLFSILNFILIGETLPMRLGKSKGNIFLIALGSIFVRYLLLAVPIVASIKYEQYNLFAAFAGIFMVQLVLLADHVAGLIPMPMSGKKAVKGKN